MIEIWKPVKGFENYEVSNLGQVKSLNYNRTKEAKILKPWVDKYGYLRVNLSKNGKGYAKKVHRLVASAFIPNIGDNPQVNHIDGDKTNNKVDNLEWVTCKENIQHAWNTGLSRMTKKHKKKLSESHKGNKNPKSKRVICVTTGEIFNCILEAEEKYNTSHISECCKGKRKTAGKHPDTGEKLIWEYLKEKLK